MFVLRPDAYTRSLAEEVEVPALPTVCLVLVDLATMRSS